MALFNILLSGFFEIHTSPFAVMLVSLYLSGFHFYFFVMEIKLEDFFLFYY